MNRRQQRETLLTMLDEELLTELIRNNFPEPMVRQKKYSSLAEKIDFVIEKYDDQEKYAELLSIISKMHTDRGKEK